MVGPEGASAACAIVVAGYFALPAAGVSAQDASPPRVLVMTQTEYGELGHRLEGELRSRGFVVLEEAPPEILEPRTLFVLAHDADAFAILLVASSNPAIQIWMVDKEAPKAVLRESIPMENQGSAVRRAAEVLRARLLEVRTPEVPESKPAARLNQPIAQRTEVQESQRGLHTVDAVEEGGPTAPLTEAHESPPAAQPQEAHDSRSAGQPPEATKRQIATLPRAPKAQATPPRVFWLAVALGVGASYVPGGLGPLPVGELRVPFRFLRRFELSVLGRLPIAGGSFEVSEGRLDWTSGSVGGIAAVHFLESLEPWDSWLGLRGQALFFRVRGDTEPPFVAGVDDAWVGAFGSEAGVRWSTGRLGIFGALALDFTTTTLRLTAGGREVASWGRPIVSATVGIWVGLAD